MKAKEKETAKTVFDFTTIKSFEDACKKEGFDPSIVPDVSKIPEEFREAILAVYKLFVAYKAINNGIEMDFRDPSFAKYWPWAKVLSSGFVFAGSAYVFDGAGTAVGSRLCTDSSEKARYMFETFEKEYEKFWLIPE